MRRVVTLGVALVGLAGCATLPPVTMRYYPPTATTDVRIVQTVACDARKEHLVIGYAMETTTAYARRPNAEPHTFRLASVSSRWADGSGTFGFTEDGRLRSVNTTSAGQGEAIVKAGVALASAAIGMPATSPCDQVDRYGDKGVLSLIYRGRIVHHDTRDAATLDLELNARDQHIRTAIGSVLPTPVATIDAGARDAQPFSLVPGARRSGLVDLTLNHTRTRTITITQPGASSSVWTATLIAPEENTYTVPVPRAALFGSRTFAMTLSEAGRPVSAGYEGASGAAGTMNAGMTLLSALAEEAVADRAAATKAEADLIAQQQRLVRCQADPEACT